MTDPTSAGDKRESILIAARRVFLRENYAYASMDSIAQEAGVSKQTLYNHFGCKERLFRELVIESVTRLGEALRPELFEGEAPPEAVLKKVGRKILDIMLSPESMELHRLMQSESRRDPEISHQFYQLGADRIAGMIAAYLEAESKKRVLRVPNNRIAAEQFVTMLMGHLRLRHLLGMGSPDNVRERRRYVNSAVALFLSGAQLCPESSASTKSTDD